MKKKLTIPLLIDAAKTFCSIENGINHPELFGKTDGKAVGTYVEHKFQLYLSTHFDLEIGNSAAGIDLPSDAINTDIKVTYFKQPQSSCPFKNAHQKIYGLGYNLLIFVYDKIDDPTLKATKIEFLSCAFVEKSRTADFQVTQNLRQLLDNQGNTDDIDAYLEDKNIPLDEAGRRLLAEEILRNRPEQGYLTISNALQWRLQYGRIVGLTENISGITQIIQKTKL
jgi:hypothetical protein